MNVIPCFLGERCWKTGVKMLVNLLRLITFESNVIGLWILAVNVCFVGVFSASCYSRIAQGENITDSVSWVFHFFEIMALWRRSISSLLPEGAVVYFLSWKSPSCHPVCWGLPISQQNSALKFCPSPLPPPPVFQHHVISNGSECGIVTSDKTALSKPVNHAHALQLSVV